MMKPSTSQVVSKSLVPVSTRVTRNSQHQLLLGDGEQGFGFDNKIEVTTAAGGDGGGQLVGNVDKSACLKQVKEALNKAETTIETAVQKALEGNAEVEQLKRELAKMKQINDALSEENRHLQERVQREEVEKQELERKFVSIKKAFQNATKVFSGLSMEFEGGMEMEEGEAFMEEPEEEVSPTVTVQQAGPSPKPTVVTPLSSSSNDVNSQGQSSARRSERKKIGIKKEQSDFLWDLGNLGSAIRPRPVEKPVEKAASKGSKSHAHDKSKAGPGLYCICGLNVANIRFLRKHLSYYNAKDEGRFRFCCKVKGCGQKFFKLAELKTHQKRGHGQRDKMVKVDLETEQQTNDQHGNDPSKVDDHACICGKQFSSGKTLYAHVHHMTSDYNFECDKCGKRFRGTNLLRKHMKAMHKVKYEGNGCRKCGQVFQDTADFRKHVNKCGGTSNQ